MNIDNNYSTNSKFPVLLTTQSSLKHLNKNNKSFFNFHIITNTTEGNIQNFDRIELELLPLTITTEYALINVIMALKEQIDSIFKTRYSSDYLIKYFKRPDGDLTQSVMFFNTVTEWETITFRTSDEWIFCRTFKLSPLRIIVTFRMTEYNEVANKEHSEDINASLFVKTLGVTFLNIDETPLTISGLQLSSVFESKDGLLNIIMTHVND